eukprot:CAMPEP_0197523982 /NCGR_PEP_ID=MMETSP1318-20131121/8777_1 /TAXON_ID=552666 /ORGANISM="Partenskyella glossopodia, Strain RCC365" /LENGTH=279 /DNA_ID=CAMNT_0043076817 /DNA_START=170 /DNA_END=1012 /DNA_ORIENTATION=+
MAVNLAKNSGKNVTVYDQVPASVQALVGKGLDSRETMKEIAKNNAVVTMLPAGKEVREVYLDESAGLLANAEPGTLFIDCTTTDPSTSVQVSEAALKKGMVIVDAPVSGGVGGAEAATLSFMVGGSEEAYTRAKDVLQHMGKNIVHCGGPGKGQVAKICNNLVLAISMIGLNEGYNLALTSGVDPQVISDIFNSSSARSWSSEYVGVPGTKDYDTGFKIALMAKDLGLATQAAKEAGVQLPLGEDAASMYESLLKMDEGAVSGKDFSYVLEYLKSLNSS